MFNSYADFQGDISIALLRLILYGTTDKFQNIKNITYSFVWSNTVYGSPWKTNIIKKRWNNFFKKFIKYFQNIYFNLFNTSSFAVKYAIECVSVKN